MTLHLNPLGDTGLLVSELCLGTMTFGGSTTSSARGTCATWASQTGRPGRS